MDSSQISSVISNSINEMFYKLFASVDNSIYSVLDDFTFIDQDVLSDYYFLEIFGYTNMQGILLIANALILGYLIYYSFKLLLSNLGITQVERPGPFLFKFIISAICINFSSFICDEIIRFWILLQTAVAAEKHLSIRCGGLRSAILRYAYPSDPL